MVASRVETLGVGLMLKRNKPEDIKDAVVQVMNDRRYKDNADVISGSFKKVSGAKEAANSIINVINDKTRAASTKK